jgi:hypothetical protein
MISLDAIPKELYGVPAVKKLVKKLQKEQQKNEQKNRPASTNK